MQAGLFAKHAKSPAFFRIAITKIFIGAFLDSEALTIYNYTIDTKK